MANVNTGDPSVLMTEEKPHLPAAYVHGHLTNARANQLFTVTHKPFEGEPKAILLWHHGLSEHISRAQQVLPSFAAVGIAVYGFDAHGHGKSEPTDKTLRSYVDTFEHLIDDFALRLKTIHDEYKESGKPVPPIFVGGNSMGGLVAGMLAARSPAKTFAGLVMLSPLIDIEWTAGLRIQAKIGAFLSYTFPKAPMVPAVRPEDMSQDPKVVQAYLTDPLMYTDKVKCRTAYESLKAMAAFQKAIPTLDIPLYIVHGSSDKCTSAAASKRYFDKSINPDKKYTTVEGGYHELLYGPEHKQVIHDVVTWILEHATGTAPTPAEPVTYTIAAAARPAAPAPAVATTVTATTNTVPAAAAATTDVSASVSASASAAACDASVSVPAAASTATTDAGDAAAAMPAAAATAANDAVVPAAASAPAPATS